MGVRESRDWNALSLPVSTTTLDTACRRAIGVHGLGFHSLRDLPTRSWLDAAGIAPGITVDLMRHSAISTTFNVYGKALSPEKREANSKVVEMLLGRFSWPQATL